MNILVFLQLQIDKIKSKEPPHAMGPKKPTLSDLDTGAKSNG